MKYETASWLSGGKENNQKHFGKSKAAVATWGKGGCVCQFKENSVTVEGREKSLK